MANVPGYDPAAVLHKQGKASPHTLSCTLILCVWSVPFSSESHHQDERNAHALISVIAVTYTVSPAMLQKTVLGSVSRVSHTEGCCVFSFQIQETKGPEGRGMRN